MYSFVSHFGALLILFFVAVVLTNAQSPFSSSSSSSPASVEKPLYPQELPCKDRNNRVSLHGEMYKMSLCSRCTCTNSTLSCDYETCQPTTCYNPLGFEDECCYWCPYNITVSNVAPLLPGTQSIQEGQAENELNVNLVVTYINNPEATSVKGQHLWQTRMWISSEADGSTELPGTVVENVLMEGQQSQPLVKRGFASTQFVINNIFYQVDMTSLSCDDAKYLCAKFNKGENPKPEKAFLDFHFSAKPTEKALTGCTPIKDCKDPISGFTREPFVSSTTMSHIRQNFNPESEAAVNKQINMEMYASYTYLSMAFYFDRSDVALPGAHKFFLRASQEERENALKLLKYQNERGGDVVLKDVRQPEKSSWGTLLDAVNDALALEKVVNGAYLDMHAIALTHSDPQMCHFIEKNFLTEKVKAIKAFGDHFTQLSRVGSGLGEYIYDKDSIGDHECS